MRGPRLTVALAWALVAAGLALPLAAGGGEPELSEVLRRAGERVARYARESAAIVADETCRQTLYKARNAPGLLGTAATGEIVPERQRAWKAELALLELPGRSQAALPWLEVRDVIEADGAALPDREPRLQRLLRDPGWQLAKAREIVEASSRFNLGPTRSINTPAIPLLVLHRPNQPRFAFTKVAEAKVPGGAAWKVEFLEQRRPTLIGAADTGWDLPSAGTFWIAPESGEVLRAEMRCGPESGTRLAVTYRRQERFGLSLPVEMAETTGQKDVEWVEGKCLYSNFRRFETGGRLLVPKAPGAATARR